MMDAVRVLVIEDQVGLADDITDGLRDHGFATDVAYDGTSGLDKALANPYDVVVLDRNLPGLHGDAVCAAIIAAPGRMQVLMLTAATSIEQRVDGFHLGAHDYLTKPFAFAELVARVNALGRRVPVTPPLLTRGELVVDRAQRQVTRGGHPIALNRKEFGVLETLIAADGAVISAEQLLDQVWDENTDPFTQTVTVTVGRLRRKLGEPALIDTVVGVGYRIP